MFGRGHFRPIYLALAAGPRAVRFGSARLAVVAHLARVWVHITFVRIGSLSTWAADSAAQPTSTSHRKLTSGSYGVLVAMGHEQTSQGLIRSLRRPQPETAPGLLPPVH